MDHLLKLATCVAVVMLFGCDLAMTDSNSSQSPSNSSNNSNDRVAELSEQNAELIQMLQEAEDKIARTFTELEASKTELESQRVRLESLETQRDEAFARLGQARNLMNELRVKFQDFTSETAKQLESLDALFPDNGQPNSNQPDSSQLLTPENPGNNKEKNSGGQN